MTSFGSSTCLKEVCTGLCFIRKREKIPRLPSSQYRDYITNSWHVRHSSRAPAATPSLATLLRQPRPASLQATRSGWSSISIRLCVPRTCHRYIISKAKFLIDIRKTESLIVIADQALHALHDMVVRRHQFLGLGRGFELVPQLPVSFFDVILQLETKSLRSTGLSSEIRMCAWAASAWDRTKLSDTGISQNNECDIPLSVGSHGCQGFRRHDQVPVGTLRGMTADRLLTHLNGH